MPRLVNLPADQGLNAAWQAVIIARHRLDTAETQDQIDASIYELKAAEIRFNEVYRQLTGKSA